MAVKPEVTWLARRRVLRSAKKSFHVSCCWEDEGAPLAFAEAVVEAWRMARARGYGLKEGRSVVCCLAGRMLVLVENDAAVAEAQGAIKTGWSRMVIVRAGRSAVEANMAAISGFRVEVVLRMSYEMRCVTLEAQKFGVLGRRMSADASSRWVCLTRLTADAPCTDKESIV